MKEGVCPQRYICEGMGYYCLSDGWRDCPYYIKMPKEIDDVTEPDDMAILKAIEANQD